MIHYSRKYIPELDFLRACAILFVLIAHYLQPNTTISWIKEIPFNYGVNLFFVLSGFLITRGLLIDKSTLKFKSAILIFFKKRILRIFPIYFGFILVLMLYDYNKVSEQLIYLITFSYNYYLSELNLIHNKDLIHFWSLAVEEQFYLFWPFFILLLKNNRIKILLIVIILFSFSYKLYLQNYTNYWVENMYGLFPNMIHLTLGALLASISNNKSLLMKVGNWYFSLVSIVLSFGLIILGAKVEFSFLKPVIIPFVTSISFTLIIAYFINKKKDKMNRLITIKPILFIGKISYGIYLFHLFIPELLRNIPGIEMLYLNNSIVFLIQTVATIIVSTLSWYLIEKPVLKLKRRFG